MLRKFWALSARWGQNVNIIISAVVFDRKDCYDTERNLLAIAKFLIELTVSTGQTDGQTGCNT